MSEPPASEAIRRRGFLLVLSSPSGAGKTTITRRLIECDTSLSLSVSVTTRPPRPGEIGGRDYRFIDQARFDAMVAEGELLEHATVFEHHYGTPRQPIEAALAAGRRDQDCLDHRTSPSVDMACRVSRPIVHKKQGTRLACSRGQGTNCRRNSASGHRGESSWTSMARLPW